MAEAEIDVKEMAAKIAALRAQAEELKGMGSGAQAVERNVDRILASIRMLEINVSELAEVV